MGRGPASLFLRLRWDIPIYSFLSNTHPRTCDPELAMKILLGILAVVLVAASLIADYKWRQWIAARRRDRQ